MTEKTEENNVIPLMKPAITTRDKDPAEGEDLEKANKDYYEKVQEAARRRRAATNSAISKDLRSGRGNYRRW